MMHESVNQFWLGGGFVLVVAMLLGACLKVNATENKSELEIQKGRIEACSGSVDVAGCLKAIEEIDQFDSAG